MPQLEEAVTAPPPSKYLKKTPSTPHFESYEELLRHAAKSKDGKLPLQFYMTQASCWEYLNRYPQAPDSWPAYQVRGHHFAGYSEREVVNYGIAVAEAHNEYDRNAVRVYAVAQVQEPGCVHYQAVGYVAKEVAILAARQIRTMCAFVGEPDVPVLRVTFEDSHMRVKIPRYHEDSFE